MNNMKDKLVEIKNLLQGHIIALIIIVVVMIGLPVTLYLVKQQQDLRSRATGGNSLTFSPSSRTVNKDSTFDVDLGISFNPTQQQLTGMDVTITYSDKLVMENFTRDTEVLSREIDYDFQPVRRTVHYIAVNRTGSLNRRTDLKLGTFRFKATGDGTATITATHGQIVVLGQVSFLDVGNANATYTIGGPSPSPSVPPGSVRGDVDKNGCLNPTARGSFAGDPVLIWQMIQGIIAKNPAAILFPLPPLVVDLNRPVDMRDYTTWWNIYRLDTERHCR